LPAAAMPRNASHEKELKNNRPAKPSPSTAPRSMGQGTEREKKKRKSSGGGGDSHKSLNQGVKKKARNKFRQKGKLWANWDP